MIEKENAILNLYMQKYFFSKESLLNVWLVWKHTDVKIKIDAAEKFGLCNINSHHGTGLRCRGKMRTTAWSFLRTISLIILISAPLSLLTSHCSADTWRGPRWRGWLRSHQRLIGSRGDLYLSYISMIPPLDCWLAKLNSGVWFAWKVSSARCKFYS